MKRLHAGLALLALAAAPAAAQRPATTAAPATAAERVDAQANARIREEGMTRSRVLETATVLSDVHGPRLAGSPGYRRAAEWARDRLASYGLRAALEPWGTRRGRGWEAARHSVELVSPYYARIVAYPKAWSPATEGAVRGEPVLVSITSEADLAKHAGRLRGKIVLNGEPRADTASRFAVPGRRFTQAQLDSLARLTEPGDPGDYWEDAGGYADRVRQRHRLAVRLREEGVAAMLEPSRNPAAVGVSAYQAYDSDVSGAVPAFVVDAGDYARLANLVRHGAAPVLEVELRTRETTNDSVGYNVVAEIPGSDPRLREEVVMAGGHLDSWTAGTGATDNAAGVAAVMEAVRILQAIGAKPRRTIRVAFWDGEEHEDYFGSLGYVRKHFGSPETMRLLPEHRRVSAYFNLDNGAGRIRGLRLQGNAAVRPVFAAILEPFRDLGAANLTIENTGSTDHMPFVSVGIPAFTFLQDPLDYNTRTHHTQRDVAAALPEADLKQAAVVVASMLLHVANRDELLPRGPLPKARQ